MPNIVTKYYTDEINEWNRSFDFHLEELNDIEIKLIELIRREENVEVAGRIEAMQKLIDRATDQFNGLQNEFKQQLEGMKLDNIYVGNSKISLDMISIQNEIRMKMREAELNYIDVKFDCYQFLSDVLQKYQY